MSYEEKLEVLMKFLDARAGKYDERSDTWYKMRCKSFGGSEIASLMGECNSEYINETKFLREKAGKMLGSIQEQNIESGRILMDWGTFFEPVHRIIMEDMFNTKIIETSLAQGINYMKGCHESPDGVAVVNKEEFLKHVFVDPNWRNKSTFDQEYLSILFEQKSPARRDPDGQVPRYYIGEVKLGLEIFDVCDVGCYTESVFVVCNVKQLFTKAYNKQIVKKRNSETTHPTPRYIGIIEFDDEWFEKNIRLETVGFEFTTEESVDTTDGQRTDPKLASLRGLGDISLLLDENSFSVLADHVKNNTIRATYHCFEYDNSLKYMADLFKKTSEMKTFMCWKLTNINFTAIEKSKGFSTLTSMFVNLGEKALDSCASTEKIDDVEFKNLEALGDLTVKQGIPLTPPNDQDDWFVENKQKIMEFFEARFDDTWDGLLVLINAILLRGSKEDYDKARKYIENAHSCCKNNTEKQESYKQFVEELHHVLSEKDLEMIGLLDPHEDTPMEDSEETENDDIIETPT